MSSPHRHATSRVAIGLPVAFILLFVLMLAPARSQAAELPANWVEFETPAQPTVAEVSPSPAGRPSEYIVGGKETTFNKHPWLVQITLNGGAFCGGALVHPMLVLTAAHCLYSAQNGAYWYQLGTMQAFTGRTMSETGGEELNIAAAGIATNYQPLDGGLSGENDYGLIALSSPSSRPVLKLAGPNERSLWRPGRTALVAGFGNIAQGGAASPVLKEVSVPLISDAFCSSAKAYGADFRSANMLCAGINKGGTGTCQGDSGGPLSVPMDGGGRRIVGIVSWADGCAKPNKPTVYVRAGDRSVSSQINQLAADAGQALNFPGVHANTNIVGSGAKPVGCKAAGSAAKKAKAGLTKAKKAAIRARLAVAKARGRAKAKARKQLNKAKSNLNKAKKKSKQATARSKSVCN